MRDAGFRHPERTPRTGGFSRHARLAVDARPPAARLGDDDAANAPTNRDEDDDDLSSSSPSESESPPPLSSALAVPSRLLARLSPRRVAEHRAFRHLARAARRLDLVASTRARRAETTRHLKRAWRVARLLAERDPTLAPLLPLLASSLRADAAAEATFSRLKNEAREGLRDAAKRLAVFAAKNAFAAEALRDLSETYARVARARNATNEDATADDASRAKRTPKTIRATRRPLRSDEFSLTNAHARFHEGLSVVETSLADRAFAALAGADPRAKVFSPSAKTVFRDETREDVFFSARDDRDGDRSDPGPEPEPDPNDDDDKNETETETETETTERPRVAIAAIARPFVYPERRMRLEERVERGATKTTEEKRLSTSFGDDEKEHCFSQSELLTSSQREAIEGDGGQNHGSHGSVRLETVDFLDRAVRATQTQSPRSPAREDET